MEAKYVIKNGELLEIEKATVSIFNKSLFFDFAVYSNIKVIQGKMFVPGLEIEKLFESAQKIELNHNFSKNDVLEWAKKLISENNLKDALIRILLIGPEKDSEPLIFFFPVGLTFYSDKLYRDGVKTITFNGERFFPTSKTKNMLLGYIAYREAVKKQALDALLVDKEGNIREGTRTSFFVIKNNTLIVPPKEKTLEGVTKTIILDLALKIMDVKEEDIHLNKINEYDEFFISGTTMGIMPLSQIDDIKLPTKLEKIKELQKLFKEYCKDKFI